MPLIFNRIVLFVPASNSFREERKHVFAHETHRLQMGWLCMTSLDRYRQVSILIFLEMNIFVCAYYEYRCHVSEKCFVVCVQF